MTTTAHRSLIKEVFWIGSIAFLPWLQIKFAAACLLLTVFLIWKIYHESRNIRRVLLIFVITAFSLIMLAVYNDYAFGKFLGPYQSDALEISKNALMVFMGLHFDQNQGFLFQNPVMFIGLFAIGALFAHSQSAALLCLLVFLSFITPNAMHPNWYGGASFSGRFSWSAAVIFFLPTVFGLIKLAQNHIKSFWIVVIGSTSLQIYFFYQYLFLNTDLYSKSFSTWFSNYSMYYFPIDSYMPALYNADWAYAHGPNYGWIILIFLIIFLGFKKNKDYGNPGKISRKTTSLIFLAGLLMIFTPGFTNQSSHYQKIVFIGKDLPSLSGQIRGTLRVAMAGTDHSGFVTFGPYLPLRRGSYRVTLRYSSSAPVEQSIGVWDVFDANESVQIAAYPLFGTAGQAKVLEASFKTHNWNAHRFEFRNYWNGVADLYIHEIGLRFISGTDHASP